VRGCPKTAKDTNEPRVHVRVLDLNAGGAPCRAGRRRNHSDRAHWVSPSAIANREPDPHLKSVTHAKSDGVPYAIIDQQRDALSERDADSHNRSHAHVHADAVTITSNDARSATVLVGEAGLL